MDLSPLGMPRWEIQAACSSAGRGGQYHNYTRTVWVSSTELLNQKNNGTSWVSSTELLRQPSDWNTSPTASKSPGAAQYQHVRPPLGLRAVGSPG